MPAWGPRPLPAGEGFRAGCLELRRASRPIRGGDTSSRGRQRAQLDRRGIRYQAAEKCSGPRLHDAVGAHGKALRVHGRGGPGARRDPRERGIVVVCIIKGFHTLRMLRVLTDLFQNPRLLASSLMGHGSWICYLRAWWAFWLELLWGDAASCASRNSRRRCRDFGRCLRLRHSSPLSAPGRPVTAIPQYRGQLEALYCDIQVPGYPTRAGVQ